jgi:hypothetical protein
VVRLTFQPLYLQQYKNITLAINRRQGELQRSSDASEKKKRFSPLLEIENAVPQL